MTGQEAGLAGQLTLVVTAEVLLEAAGFDKAAPGDFIKVDADLKTVASEGVPNRQLASICESTRPVREVNSIIHAHSPVGFRCRRSARTVGHLPDGHGAA